MLALWRSCYRKCHGYRRAIYESPVKIPELFPFATIG
jgi:hypothetical protein